MIHQSISSNNGPNRMAKLFQTEKFKMAESDKAEILQKSTTTARKQSLLPKGNLFITLLHICSNMTNTCVFCILEFDEDEDDDEKKLSSEDNDDDDDEDYEDK